MNAISRRLAAHRAASAARTTSEGDLPDDETDPNLPEEEDCSGDPKPKGKKKDNTMTDIPKAEHEAALAKAATDAAAATNARWGAVLASEHYEGRETLALNLLGNAAMSADAITAALAAAPKAAPEGSTTEVDTEAAGRDEMKKALAEAAGNSTVDAGSGGASGSAAASTDALWAKAINRVCPSASA